MILILCALSPIEKKPELPAIVQSIPSSSPLHTQKPFSDPLTWDSVDSADINGQDHSALASPSFSSTYLKISVSDPLREQELSGSLVPGGNSYISYLITTFTNMPEFNGTEFNVRRRRKTFQVMQTNEFVEQRRAALEKYLRRLASHPVIRGSEELRVFLEASGKMTLVRTTDVASRMLDGAVRLPKQLIGGNGGAADMGELKQSVTNDWGGAKPPIVEDDKEFLERKEKLQDFEQQLVNVSQQVECQIDNMIMINSGYVRVSIKVLTNLVDRGATGGATAIWDVLVLAESLVKAQQDIGETMGQLGLAFVKLTKFETEEAIYDSQRARAADMKNVATAAVKASRLYRELNAQTVKHLVSQLDISLSARNFNNLVVSVMADKLHEYLGVMLAVNNAFSDRSSAFLTVQTLLSDLSSLHSRIEKLEAASSKIFGGDRSRIRKIEELRETVRVTEDAKNSAVREYEQIKAIAFCLLGRLALGHDLSPLTSPVTLITMVEYMMIKPVAIEVENNRNELERLDKERHDDFMNMLKGFIVNQVGYAEKMANVWETVAEETSGYVKKMMSKYLVVRRSGNLVVHYLTRHAFSLNFLESIRGDFPQHIVNSILEEGPH
ncbi:hypothetical protein DH2020_044262 [Rehmannia glutinosa]|uniref:PX domain-containing protein n=1 Tax=Rehmannia glutinosa TaxID=99300 RepID=A0ABR0UHE7_REHGL